MKKLCYLLVSMFGWWSHISFAQIPTNGLVVHYPFDGNTLDVSGNNHHAFNVSGPVLTQDRAGNCDRAYRFSNFPHTIQIPHQVLNGLEDLTFSVWIRLERYDASLITATYATNPEPAHNQYLVHIRSSGSLTPVVKEAVLEGGPPLPLNTWMHLALVRQSSPAYTWGYLNGSLWMEGPLNFSSIPVNATGPLIVSANNSYLGNDLDCPSGCFEPNNQFYGNMDDVRIYSRKLTLAEIQALAAERPAVDAGLSASNSGPGCTGDNINLTATNIAGATYTWTGPNGFFSTVQNPVLTAATPAMNGVYTVKARRSPTCELTSSTTVQVNSIPSATTISSNTPVCAGGTLSLNAAAVPNATYEWTGPNNFTGSGQNLSISNVSLAQAGTYRLRVRVNNCLSATSEHVVAVHAAIPTIFSRRTATLSCDTLSVMAVAPRVVGAQYLWSTGDTTATLLIKGPGKYWVRVSNACQAVTDTIDVSSSKNVIIANAFSPNGDGINEFFELPASLRGAKLSVYNRWGDMVFGTDSYQNNWNGESCPSGVYHYEIIQPCFDAPVKGSVFIVR